MELFDNKIMKEFMQWKESNPNFSWWQFLNIKSDLLTALAFSKFFYPEIMEKEGYFLLKDKFEEEIFIDWKKDCNGNKEKVEKMMNLYQISDFFHINIDKNETPKHIETFGKILKKFWEMSFRDRFPKRDIKVKVFQEEDLEWFITVYEVN